MTMESFVETVRPLAEALAGLPLEDAATAREIIEGKAPFKGELVASVRMAVEAGLQSDWLLTKEVGGNRFGRASKDLHGFSVDIVYMDCPGPKHRHPKGEIDLCFAIDGAPRFDGHEQGWVVYPPGSVHVPTVSGGKMLIIYLLPGGAFEMIKEY